MSSPLFCPHRGCRYHSQVPTHTRWYHVAGYYQTKAFGRVRRFRCLGCGHYFSEQTFSLDYYIKHPIDYRAVFRRAVGGAGLRTIARELSVSHQLISNRLSRLARQALGLQAQMLETMKVGEDLAADGFESFVGSQYRPNNIHLLVGSRSQFLYAFDYAHLKRKGRMSEEQKRKREELEERMIRKRRPVDISFAHMLETLERLLQTGGLPAKLRMFTDKKRDYRTVIGKSAVLKPLRREGRFAHVRISSRKARTLRNRLFPVNYLDRQLRKDNANHVRETVQFSRNVNNCLERLAVYQLWHNYCKPYRIDDGPKGLLRHAQVAGVDRKRIDRQLEHIFERRKFLSKVSLSWSQALVWLRMVGNTDRHTGGFWPAYVWM